MSEGLAFEALKKQLAQALADLRHKELGMEIKEAGTFEDEVDKARATWLLFDNTYISITQTIYNTDVALWMGEELLGYCSDGNRLFAEATALVNALSNPLLSRLIK